MIEKSFYNYFKGNINGLKKAEEILKKHNRRIKDISRLVYKKKEAFFYDSQLVCKEAGNYAVLKEKWEIFLG